MPPKRKAPNIRRDTLPKKRTRGDTETITCDDFFIPESADASDCDKSDVYSDDYAVTYKDDGSKRADSEARRAWNYVCDFGGCGQRFNRPCRLEAHIRSHQNLRPYVCHHAGCDKTFPRKDHLSRHLKNAHAASENDFRCDWVGCGKIFSSLGRLQRHKEVHESKFYCTWPPCDQVFRKEKTREAHVQMEHLGAKPFPCTAIDSETGEKCTLGYQTEVSLRRHLTKVHAKMEETHICMICIPEGTEHDTMQNDAGEFITIPQEPLRFATQEELSKHSREVHKPTCIQCGLVFKTPANLQSHLQTVHADPETKPQFRCPRDDCDKVFGRRHNLTVHIQHVHDKQYQYYCTTEAVQSSKHPDLANWDGANACGDAFKAKSSLEQHIRTHHLALPNRKTMRKAAKSRKQNPKPGVLTHLTGVGYDEGREVACLVQHCEYRFFRDVDLRRHLRSAAHKLSEVETNELILERDAAVGGQFWLGGLDPGENESQMSSYLDSLDPSGPQTPMLPPYPFYADSSMHVGTEYGSSKNPGVPHGVFDPQLAAMDMQMFDDDGAELDKMMGLGDLPPAIEAAEGLQWDMLDPVQQYISQEMQD